MGFWKGRYSVILIMFIAWILSYVDRMVMSVSMPYIAKDFHLTPVAVGILMSSFFFGYALMQIPAGMLADRFGVRKVITVGLVWWSAFTALTAWAGSYAIMLVIRVLFGLGEACLPPSYFKSVAFWTPLKERGTMNSIVMSSNSLGPALAPLFAVGIIAAYGWRSVFSFLFIPGIIMAGLVWIFVSEKPEESRWISKEEVEEISAGSARAQEGKQDNLTIGDALKNPVVWKVLCTLFVFMIAAWGYMTWLPSYLVKARGLSLAKMGPAASLPFFAGFVGAIVAGYLSDKLFLRHRNILYIICVLLAAVFLYLTYSTAHVGPAIAYNTLAGFFLMAANAGLTAIPITVIPKEIMGVSMGVINFGNQMAGFLAPTIIGFLVQFSGGSFNSTFIFLIIACLLTAVISLSLRERPAGSGGVEGQAR
ncbi:MAG TPA: MFS transporter [Syntrophorhabdales bacterium]|nr:MFS transporter [Syntrophorhabdales bacterium]